MRSPKEMQLMIEKLKAEVAALKAQLIENGLTPSLGAHPRATPEKKDIDKSLLGDSQTNTSTSTQ